MPRTFPLLRATALAAALMTGALCAAPVFAAGASSGSTQASRQVDRIGDAFYVARAKFEPLLYATANGDSRYDDQLGMAISPVVRAQ